MPSVLQHDLYQYLALAAMLLAILFGSWKGRGVGPAGGQSLGWTRIPLIAFAITSIGPSVFAVLIYLGYKTSVLQPPASGYKFSTYISDLPLEFAVMNWPFVAVYLACRLRPDAGAARSAMWGAVIAMSLPNVLLFATAWDMVSNVRDAGQGIGIVQAMLTFPIGAMILPHALSGMPDAGLSVLSALTGPIPVLGLFGWLAGRMMGSAASGTTSMC
jgi:hypothetical protein